MQRTSVSACSIWFSLCVLLFLGSWGQVAKANPELPIISNQTFAVTNAAYGAVGDGATDNAAAIRRAITDAAAHGGGTVLIPANGTLSSYLSGPIGLSNGINFQVDSGVLLQMLPYGTYPGSTNFIGGTKLHDVELSGSGTIDGQGAAWWTAYNSSNALTLATPGGHAHLDQRARTRRHAAEFTHVPSCPDGRRLMNVNNDAATILHHVGMWRRPPGYPGSSGGGAPDINASMGVCEPCMRKKRSALGQGNSSISNGRGWVVGCGGCW